MEGEPKIELMEIVEITEPEIETNYLKQNVQNDDSSGTNQPKAEPQQRPIYEMNMDETMNQLGVPCRKIMGMENAYFLALNTKEEIEETVVKLQALTKVTWSVKQTKKFIPCVKKRPKKPITLFKRQYGCHMSTRTRTKTKKIRHKKSRNINCPAQLMVSIKSFVSSSRAKFRPPQFDKELPCIFEFRHHHNHKVDVAEVLTNRPMGDDLKAAICKILDKGHSCASAYHTIYTLKVEEFGGNYKEKMADRHHFPRRNDVSTIYKTHGYKDKYENIHIFSNMVKHLEELLFAYQKKNGTLYRLSLPENETIVICLCTPLMQRAAQQVSDVLIIDSSNDDCREYKSYFILTHNAAGALPICCILTNKQHMSAFGEGMKLFFQMMNIQPAIVLTSGAIMAELVAQKYFPNSKMLFSFYHALSSTWKVLYETRHELARAKKESYYSLFREVVFADSEEGLVVARQVLAVECAHTKFLNYIDKMYENITLWSLYYRRYTFLHGKEPFNYDEAELSFRLFRLISRVALDRTKLFNLTQVADFMCSAFEKYYKNRIFEIVLAKKSKVLEGRYGSLGTEISHMEDIGHQQFLFRKAIPDVLDEYYQVDMITHQCTCGMGALGKHCQHIADILATNKVFSPELTPEQQAAAYFVTTGVLKHKNSFLPEGDQNLAEEHETLCHSPETILGSEYSQSHEDENKRRPLPDLETTKGRWLSYCNKIVTMMENDPAKFLPAVNVHLDNIRKYSTGVPMLLKGLYAGFPYMGDTDNLPPLAIINSKTSAASVSQTQQTSSTKTVVPTPSINRLLPPPLINMKQKLKDAAKGIPNSAPPSLTSIQGNEKDIKSVKMKVVKRFSLLNPADASWNNVSSASSSPLSIIIENCETTDELSEEEDSKHNIQIVDEEIGGLVRKSSEEDISISKNSINFLDGKTVTFAETVTLNQLSNLEDIAGNDSGMFEIQKGIFVDQAALSQLTGNDVGVLDEKKGILIIPMATD